MNNNEILSVYSFLSPGLDNAFVILNSWHRSDKKASVEDRLGDTMSEAGVSILITSLTDIISFYTAVLAPYPYVKIFCLYTGTALAFNFIYQVTPSNLRKSFIHISREINFLLFTNVVCI